MGDFSLESSVHGVNSLWQEKIVVLKKYYFEYRSGSFCDGCFLFLSIVFIVLVRFLGMDECLLGEPIFIVPIDGYQCLELYCSLSEGRSFV